VRALRGVTLTIRFICELAMLAALGYWGFDAGDGVWAWVLGLGVPAVAIAVWAEFVAPKARWPLPVPLRLLVELVLFGAAAVGLAVAGETVLAVVLAIAAGVTSVLNAIGPEG
jgi:hypothetical protein